jgi:hypothetical protein
MKLAGPLLQVLNPEVEVFLNKLAAVAPPTHPIACGDTAQRDQSATHGGDHRHPQCEPLIARHKCATVYPVGGRRRAFAPGDSCPGDSCPGCRSLRGIAAPVSRQTVPV